jgi:hypothetical protein
MTAFVQRRKHRDKVMGQGSLHLRLAREHGADDEARSILIPFAKEEALQINP